MVPTQHRATDPERRTERAPGQDTQAPTAYEVAGELSDLELYEQALLTYEEAIERNPIDFLAYIGKGNMLLFLGQPAEALLAYSTAARLNPMLALAYVGQGMALRRLGRYRAALDAYDEAISCDPTFAPAYFGKGFMLLRLKHFWQALRVYWRGFRLEV